jgi:hypothetical protein
MYRYPRSKLENRSSRPRKLTDLSESVRHRRSQVEHRRSKRSVQAKGGAMSPCKFVVCESHGTAPHIVQSCPPYEYSMSSEGTPQVGYQVLRPLAASRWMGWCVYRYMNGQAQCPLSGQTFIVVDQIYWYDRQADHPLSLSKYCRGRE